MSTTSPEIFPDDEFEHDVFTATEAAKILRVGRSTMYKLIENRKIEYIKCGRKILIPLIYLRKFVENNTIMCYNSDQMEMNLSCCGKGEA